MEADRWNRLHPAEPQRTPFVTTALSEGTGPVVAVTDFMRAVADQIQPWVPRPYIPLGTDGFGRSDTRSALRRFFETDTGHVVAATLSGLVREGALPAEVMARAFERYDIDPDVGPPWKR